MPWKYFLEFESPQFHPIPFSSSMGSSMCTPVVDSNDEEKPMIEDIRSRQRSIDDVTAQTLKPASLELISTEPSEKELTLTEYFPNRSSYARTEKGLLLSVILLRMRKANRPEMKKMTILQPCRLHKINENPLQDLRESLYVNSRTPSKCKIGAKRRERNRGDKHIY